MDPSGFSESDSPSDRRALSGKRAAAPLELATAVTGARVVTTGCLRAPHAGDAWTPLAGSLSTGSRGKLRVAHRDGDKRRDRRHGVEPLGGPNVLLQSGNERLAKHRRRPEPTHRRRPQFVPSPRQVTNPPSRLTTSQGPSSPLSESAARSAPSGKDEPERISLMSGTSRYSAKRQLDFRRRQPREAGKKMRRVSHIQDLSTRRSRGLHRRREDVVFTSKAGLPSVGALSTIAQFFDRRKAARFSVGTPSERQPFETAPAAIDKGTYSHW